MDESPERPRGRCACDAVEYEVTGPPLFVHGCHCTACQRETGSAFAVNALVETERVSVLRGALERVDTPSESGAGQLIVRCASCHVALWSHYGAAKEAVAFVRVGTLDEPARWPPDLHIYTRSKLPWVQLPEGAPSVEAFYRRSERWPPRSVERYQKALGR